MAAMGLKFGPIDRSAAHLCVDMQRLFADATPWHTPWMKRILPQVCALTEKVAHRTVFTRFMPPENAQQMHGAWKRYYERWELMTLEKMDRDMVELVPELAQFVPPAKLFDKHVYSPWTGLGLHQYLHEKGFDTLLMSGGETDVCLMAAVSGAIDLGYRVIILRDAVCSSRDSTHDEMLDIFSSRYDMQIEVIDTEDVLRIL